MTVIGGAGEHIENLIVHTQEGIDGIVQGERSVDAARTALGEFETHLLGMFAAREKFNTTMDELSGGLKMTEEGAKAAGLDGQNAELGHSRTAEAQRIVFHLDSLLALAQSALARTTEIRAAFDEGTAPLGGLKDLVKETGEGLAVFDARGDNSLENMGIKSDQILTDAHAYRNQVL